MNVVGLECEFFHTIYNESFKKYQVEFLVVQTWGYEKDSLCILVVKEDFKCILGLVEVLAGVAFSKPKCLGILLIYNPCLIHYFSCVWSLKMWSLTYTFALSLVISNTFIFSIMWSFYVLSFSLQTNPSSTNMVIRSKINLRCITHDKKEKVFIETSLSKSKCVK